MPSGLLYAIAVFGEIKVKFKVADDCSLLSKAVDKTKQIEPKPNDDYLTKFSGFTVIARIRYDFMSDLIFLKAVVLLPDPRTNANCQILDSPVLRGISPKRPRGFRQWHALFLFFRPLLPERPHGPRYSQSFR